MRAYVVGLALMAAPAMGQSLDGKATLSGPVAEILSVSAPPLSTETVRGLITASINKPSGALSAEEKDFFAELAAGSAVEVVLPSKTVKVPPLAAAPLHTAQLLATPPNLNTLWKQRGPPAQDLLEIARWGDRGRGRVVQYMGNMLFGAWAKSRVENQYTPWQQEWLGANNAFEASASGEDLKRAKLLLKDAVIQLFAKCKADGREPPPKFLYDVQLTSVGAPMPE